MCSKLSWKLLCKTRLLLKFFIRAKNQKLNNEDVGKKFRLEPNYSRDTNLTDFGKATLLDRYLLPGEKFQDMFLSINAIQMMTIMQKNLRLYFKVMVYASNTLVYQTEGLKEAYQFFFNTVQDSLGEFFQNGVKMFGCFKRWRDWDLLGRSQINW